MKTNKTDILFELIITQQCNLRCPYCPVEFKNKKMTKQVLNDLISFITHSRKDVRKFFINFFGGEPMLEFKKIKYLIEKTKHLKIEYSISTNGLLITNEVFKYFNKNNVEITLSIDHYSNKKLEYLYPIFKNKDLSNIVANLVVSPDNINRYSKLFQKSFDLGIRNFTFLPIYISPLDWDNKSLKELESLTNKLYSLYLKYKNTAKEFKLHKCSFENEIIGIKEFVILYNGKVYADYQGLLWCLKQFKKIDPSFKKLIESKSLLGNIKELNLSTLEKKHSNVPLKNLRKTLIKNVNAVDRIKKITKIIKPLPDFS